MNKIGAIIVVAVVVTLLDFGFVASSPAAEPMTKGGFTTYDTLRLMGAQVKNARGEVLGAINDFVFDQDGHIVFATLCHECYDDWGGKNVAVPLSALKISRTKTNDLKVVLNVDSKKLDAAPAYSLVQGMPDRGLVANVYRYFGQQPFWSEKEFGFVASSSAAEPMAKGGFTTYDTLRLMGTEVKNTQGEGLGAISDFVFDQDGHIVFATLCHECYEDSPIAKDVAVPISALKISGMKTNDLKVVLNVDSKKLDAAPAYSLAQGMPDRGLVANVYRYYGQQPPWKEKEAK